MQPQTEALPDTGVASTPWRPRSLSVAPKRRLLRGNSLLLAAVVAGHIGALFLLARGMAPDPAEFEDDEVMEVRFVERPPETPLEPETVLILPPTVNEKTTEQSVVPPPREQPRRAHPPQALQAVEPAPRKQALALYDANGRVKLPEGLMDDLEAKVGDKRVFEYLGPGQATGRKGFHRVPPLV